ncbi:peptidoglycan DD-metalloendopeptidase family protein [Pontibacillus salicampi]|uniref:Peptidoglycan DD-metalloendopeptidase family protein n=1 Tax=Pontibacillus salicampi TaxID=1449801 RepID=A0ABV6LS80_9BACI
MREEENKSVSKNTWKRVFRKKWFFPSVYLITAALLLTGVLWYQNTGTNNQAEQPGAKEDVDSIDFSYEDNDAEPVMEQSENLSMPVEGREEVVIKTKFYDANGSKEDQEQALVFYENRYYQSKGISIAKEDGKVFDVTASASGTVTEVKEDPLFGQLVELTHENNVTTKYMSLGEVLVEVGAEVQQGDVIATAGKNLAGKDAGVHVHFEVRKGDTALNPEEFFNQPLNKLEASNGEEENEGTEEEQASEEQSTEQSAEESSDQSEGADHEEGQDPSDKEDAERSEDTPEDSESGTEEPNEDTQSSISMTNA